jgi:hypothetical protein
LLPNEHLLGIVIGLGAGVLIEDIPGFSQTHQDQFVIAYRAFIVCCITGAVGKNVSIIQCQL